MKVEKSLAPFHVVGSCGWFLATQKKIIISLIGDFLSKKRECMTKFVYLFIYSQNGEMCSLVSKLPTNLIFYPLVSKPLIDSRFFQKQAAPLTSV